MTDPTLSELADELAGWKETPGISDDARRKIWLMHKAAAALRAAETEIARLNSEKHKFWADSAALFAKLEKAEAALAAMQRDFVDIAAMEGAEGMTDAKFAEIALGIANAALARLTATPPKEGE